jgi:OOP family OmpA-OmpF porin
MKQMLKVAALLAALGFAGNAMAQGDGSDEVQASDVAHALSGRPWYVSGMFSYTDSDSDRGTEGGLGSTISVGKKVTWGLTLELTGYYSYMDSKSGGGSADLYGYGASALFFPSKTIPNAYGIISLMQGRTEGLPGPRHDYDSTVFDVGLGYLQPLTARILLRAEARYRTDDKGSEPTGSKGKNSNFAEGVYSVGLLIPFGGVAVQPGTPEDAAAAVVDTTSTDDDNDGVGNDDDQCPGSPAGAVDSSGCPITGGSGGSAEAAPPADEHAAECRTPAAGDEVDEYGCAVSTRASE